jgi:uncharacterized caspase-like protein
MTRFAIIIGVEKYDHFSETKFAHADSTLMYSTLVEKCDYAKQNSLLLNISPDNKKSPSDVLAEIRSAISKSTPGDSVLFYFAGHGHYADGHAFLILPNTIPGAFESTALPLDDVSEELRDPHRLCFRIFDSCHSGLDVRDGQGKLNAEGFVRTVTHENSGWVTLAACRDDESSVCDAEIGHGVFTYHMCEYISDLGENDLVYPEMVKFHISDKVIQHAKKLGYSQTPTLNASISGNISLAIRRANSSAKSSGQIELLRLICARE